MAAGGVFLLEKADVLVDDGVYHQAVSFEIVALKTCGLHCDDRFSLLSEFIHQRLHVVAHNAGGAACQHDLQLRVQDPVRIVDDLPQSLDAAEDHFLLAEIGTR